MSPAVPRQTCPDCQEYLPHYCAEVVAITRDRGTGKRVITITARPERKAAA
jgi:methyl coenzyme M reductase subunit C-like uncharacterized protein (methanogenesis marker protein 7)